MPKFMAKSDVLAYPAGLDRAVYLREKYHVSLLVLAEYFSLSPPSIIRAVVAKNSGRRYRANGRPRSVNDSGEAILVQKIIYSYDRLDCLTCEDVAILVCTVFFLEVDLDS